MIDGFQYLPALFLGIVSVLAIERDRSAMRITKKQFLRLQKLAVNVAYRAKHGHLPAGAEHRPVAPSVTN
jgi:hypothetical protein